MDTDKCGKHLAGYTQSLLAAEQQVTHAVFRSHGHSPCRWDEWSPFVHWERKKETNKKNPTTFFFFFTLKIKKYFSLPWGSEVVALSLSTIQISHTLWAACEKASTLWNGMDQEVYGQKDRDNTSYRFATSAVCRSNFFLMFSENIFYCSLQAIRVDQKSCSVKTRDRNS